MSITQTLDKASYTNHPKFRNFISSLKTYHTKKIYSHYLHKFYLSRPENIDLTLDQILSKNPKDIEYEVMGIVEEMKDKLSLSYASINFALVAILHFFEINDVVINKKKINRFKGDNVSKYEYRSYTTEGITKLLSVCDDRGKAAILLMASTGMRVGALQDLKIKHLKKWMVEASSYHVYQITVYSNSPRNKYFTFCTPEAAQAIDNYLALRKRYGDNIHDPNSFIFLKNFNKMIAIIDGLPRSNKNNGGRPCSNEFVDRRPINSRSISNYIVEKLIEIGIRTLTPLTKEYTKAATLKHELHPCHSLRIFCVTNMQRSKVDKTIREMLVGHSTGLDKSYYKPQDEEILQEYLKAVDSLTINNENKLKKQIKILQDKNKDSEYIIKGKLEEKDEQIKSLTDQFSSMKNMIESLVKGLSETKDQQQVNSVTHSLFSSGIIKEI